MNMLEQLVDTLVEYADGKTICMYTASDMHRECVEHLAEQIPMRGAWLYWNGKSKHSEPPIYVPVVSGDVAEDDIMSYMDSIAELTANLGISSVSLVGHHTEIPGTQGILYMDHDSTDRVLLVYIGAGYKDTYM